MLRQPFEGGLTESDNALSAASPNRPSARNADFTPQNNDDAEVDVEGDVDESDESARWACHAPRAGRVTCRSSDVYKHL